MKRARFLPLAALVGLASLYVGLRVGSARQPLAVHPLTGRTISGVATDAGWMDRASREAEESPAQALSLVGLERGMTVADVGAGSGYMTMRLANVEAVLGTETDANLPENAVDVALLVDVYHEFQHPREMLRSIRRSLKPGGRLVLIEYRKEDRTIPIAPTHRLSVAEARAEISEEGFTFDHLNSDLPRQHVLVFRR